MLHREQLQVRDREVGNFSDVFLHHSWLPLDKNLDHLDACILLMAW